MDSNTTYEQEIDLKDLMFVVLHQWRIIIIIAVLSAVALGGLKGASVLRKQRDAEYVKQAQETYDNDLKLYESSREAYEKEIENLVNTLELQKEYREQSILMNTSPYNIYEARADLFVKTDYQIMPGMTYQNLDYTNAILQSYQSLLTNKAILGDTADRMGIDVKYLQELVAAERPERGSAGQSEQAENILTLTVRHPEEDAAREILKELLGKLDTLHDQVVLSIGEHSITVVNEGMGSLVDLALADRQKQESSKLAELQKTLDEKKKALSELKEPSAPSLSFTAVLKRGIKYGVLGGVLGAFMTVFFVCVVFLMSDRIYAPKELRNKFKVKVLGVLPAGEKKKCFVDRWLDRLEGKNVNVNVDSEYALISANIENLSEGVETLLVTGTAGAEKIAQVSEKLEGQLKGARILAGENLLQCAETIRKLPGCDGVILVEQSRESTVTAVRQEMEAIQDLDKTIIGCVMFD